MRIEGVLSDALVSRLPTVEVSTGSACSSDNPMPSHTLLAMGLDANAAYESFRVSLGRETTPADMERGRFGDSRDCVCNKEGGDIMDLESACEPVFARHESFHLRYGWLKKAYEQVKYDGGIFVNERATVKLGVGKNMVRAIKFWGLASKLFEDAGPGKVCPTDFGRIMLDDDEGHDPYLEYMETLWLLHWLLLSKPCKIPVWWIIMNKFSAGNVSVSDVRREVEARVRGGRNVDHP